MKIDREELELRKFMSFVLLTALHKKGITQIELGQQVGILKSAINDIFVGKTTPSLVRTLKIFKALDIEINSFVSDWEYFNLK
jgi:transcriptional regulator with XRE-family HTH domain